ncbi:Ig-like domain-containing protein, partial [Marinomonas transparens]
TATLSGDGKHELNAKATDAAGNVGSTRNFEVTLDTVTPTLTLNITDMDGKVLQPGASTGDTNLVFSGIGEPGLRALVFDRVDSETRTLLSEVVISEDGTWSTTVTLSGDGNYQFYAFSYDAAFNALETGDVEITVDT